jgi:hypothetical protein
LEGFVSKRLLLGPRVRLVNPEIRAVYSVDEAQQVLGIGPEAAAKLFGRRGPVVVEMQSKRIGPSARKALEKLIPPSEFERGNMMSVTMSGRAGKPVELRTEHITQHRNGVISVTAVKTFPRPKVPPEARPLSWGRLK